MPKTRIQLAVDVDEAIAAQLADALIALDPLIEAYRSLTGGQVPPAITAAFPARPTGTAAKPTQTKPKAASKRRGGGPGRQGKPHDQGRASKTAILQALDVADHPLTCSELAERVPLNVSTITEKLRSLAREGTVTEVEVARGPHPARWALPSKVAEWDDPEQLDEDLDEDEPVLPGEEPPPLEDDESTADAIAAAAAPHSPTSNAGIVSAGMSARVRRALQREQADPPVEVADTGEQLLDRVMAQLALEPAKPRDVARALFESPPEVAQAIRVAENRHWLRRCTDGTFEPTGLYTGPVEASNGHAAAAA